MFWKLTGIVVLTLLSKGCFGQIAQCGQAPSNTRIVGGQNASISDWPWQVSLQKDGSHFCGGSLISTQWILSAAHCFTGLSSPSVLTVYLGRQSLDLPNANEAWSSVSRVIVHPLYNPAQSNDNDIALLYLSSPVELSPNIQPVCLASSSSTYNSENVWVTGWGDINEGVALPAPQVLQDVSVPIVENSLCNCLYGGGITDNMLCAGLLTGGKDSCQGDSGGPMVFREGPAWVQIGVVSFGKGCAEPKYPGVYTRVSQYEAWIKNYTGPYYVQFISYTSTSAPNNQSVSCSTTLSPTPAPCVSSVQSMAEIKYFGVHKCSGTVITPQFVLTSAGCFSWYGNNYGVTVSVIFVSSDCSQTSQQNFTVANVIFDASHTVALVELEGTTQFFNFLPVDVNNMTVGPSSTCEVAAWSTGGQSIQQTPVNIVACDPLFASGSDTCTGLLNLQTVDEGSALVCQMGGQWIQIGLLEKNNGLYPESSNTTAFINIFPFTDFLTSTIYNVPSVMDGAGSITPVTLTCLLTAAGLLHYFY